MNGRSRDRAQKSSADHAARSQALQRCYNALHVFVGLYGGIILQLAMSPCNGVIAPVFSDIVGRTFSYPIISVPSRKGSPQENRKMFSVEMRAISRGT